MLAIVTIGYEKFAMCRSDAATVLNSLAAAEPVTSHGFGDDERFTRKPGIEVSMKCVDSSLLIGDDHTESAAALISKLEARLSDANSARYAAEREAKEANEKLAAEAPEIAPI